MTKTIIFITAAAYLLSWLTRFAFSLKRLGFDPSLATYADPLSLRSMFGYRLLAVFGIATCGFGLIACQIFATVLIMASLLHLMLLFGFERQKTQPAGYYLFAVVIGTAITMTSTNRALLALVFVGCQEVYLAIWQSRQKQIYNRWVADGAKKINRRYHQLGQKIKPAEWFWILHIATTESIARPTIVRVAERLYFRARHPGYISTGIMQVRGKRPISDIDSMRHGAKIVCGLLSSMPAGLSRSEQIDWISNGYNGSGTYSRYLRATANGLDIAWHEIHQS